MFTFIMTIYLIVLVYMTIAVIVNLSAKTTVGRISNLINLPSDEELEAMEYSKHKKKLMHPDTIQSYKDPEEEELYNKLIITLDEFKKTHSISRWTSFKISLSEYFKRKLIAHASTLIVALLWGLFFLLTYLI